MDFKELDLDSYNKEIYEFCLGEITMIQDKDIFFPELYNPESISSGEYFKIFSYLSQFDTIKADSFIFKKKSGVLGALFEYEIL